MDLAWAGLVIVMVVLLVVTVFDSTAVPWPLRLCPLPGAGFAAAGSLLDWPVLVAVGLGLVNVGLGAQVWWDQVLGGARQGGKGRHSYRRRPF